MMPTLFDEELLQIAEALLIASPEPLTQARFNQSLDRKDVDLNDVVTILRDRFEDQERPIEIVAVAGGFQVVTRSEFQPYLQRLFRKSGKLSLTRAALEALAIIAYRQPVPRSEIDQIRGVNSESVLRTLLENKLITIKGRDETVGRPLLYGTTQDFLLAFGLKNLSDLPKLREIEEIVGAEEPGPTPVEHASE